MSENIFFRYILYVALVFSMLFVSESKLYILVIAKLENLVTATVVIVSTIKATTWLIDKLDISGILRRISNNLF